VEALTNVVRHAGARQVDVALRAVGSQVELSVRDDGIGFDVPDARRRASGGASQGVFTKEARALLAGGTLRIDSRPGQGTTVRARFAAPVHDARSA
jgi:two-component system, NarL family, sensor histidine kinase UhpB